jgi:hypothetical protein
MALLCITSRWRRLSDLALRRCIWGKNLTNFHHYLTNVVDGTGARAKPPMSTSKPICYASTRHLIATTRGETIHPALLTTSAFSWRGRLHPQSDVVVRAARHPSLAPATAKSSRVSRIPSTTANRVSPASHFGFLYDHKMVVCRICS